MKHLQLYEYYQRAPLTGTEMVRLYRGDSDYIHEFDPAKFDPKSLFGKGTYLTDSRFVASTYTTKGNKERVVASFYAEGRKSKSAKLKFVVIYIMGQLLHPGTKIPFEQEGYNEWQKQLREYYESMTDAYEILYQPIQSTNPQYAAYNAERVKDRKKYEAQVKRMRKKYDPLLAQAWEIFNKQQSRYKFLATSYKSKDNEMTWEVIDLNVKKGHISEFDVPKALLDNCYDAEDRTDADIRKLRDAVMLKSFSLPTSWQGETLKEKIVDYEWRKNNQRQYFDTLGAFFYNMIAREWDETCWTMFREGMQQMGYTGIRYQGGKYTGSPTGHNAYVIWDFSKLVRVR